MHNLGIIYLENYKPDEEAVLEQMGVPVCRITNPKLPNIENNDWPLFKKYILRGNRMSVSDYNAIVQSLKTNSLTSINSPDDYTLNSSFELHYEKFKDYSPVSIFFPRTTSEEIIIRTLTKKGIIPPIFVRTDKESAAKYVGFDGCIMSDILIEELVKCTTNIFRHIDDFECFIFKEVEEIATAESGDKLEYRIIFIEGKDTSYDYDTKKLPDPSANGIKEFAVSLAKELAENGMGGAFFIDVAITKSGRIIVVECKDIINGTIKNLTDFAKGIKSN